MTEVILGICLLVAIVAIPLGFIFMTKVHVAEKKELHDRLMARDYPEFMQGKDYQLDLDAKEKELSAEEKKDKLKLSPEEYSDKYAASKL